MNESDPSNLPRWIYGMTSEESTQWYQASHAEKCQLLAALGSRVVGEVIRQGLQWFVICDTYGQRVAKGELAGSGVRYVDSRLAYRQNRAN